MSTKAVRSTDMVKVAVMLQRPTAADLEHLTRSEKYRALRENSMRVRAGLIDWIEERGMHDEVERVGEPTIFNTLFVVATQRVAGQLHRAPGVIGVGSEEAVRVDLPHPVQRATRH